MTLLAWFTIAWVVGVWLASLLVLPSWGWAAAAGLSLIAAVLVRGARTRLLLVVLLALALGATRFRLAEPRFDPDSLVNFHNQDAVTLEGVVAEEPDVRDTFVFYKLDAQRLRWEGSRGEERQVHGAVRVTGPRYPVYEYGDRLLVTGKLNTPPVLREFDYRDYLARQGIHSYMERVQVDQLSTGEGSSWKRTMLTFKRQAQETIGRILPEPEASLLTGILLGIEHGIPPDTMAAFAATGTTHVIAISGFNITIVIALLMATVGRLARDRRLAGIIAIGGVLLYTTLVGADAAVVRAAAMGIVAVIGLVVGRQGVAYNTLAAAALAMLALNPYVLWDVGFQLSVAATLGLILYGSRLEAWAFHGLSRFIPSERAERFAGWISEALLLTVAAQILTTPLIVKYFGQLSLVSLLSNLLVLPIQPLVMACGGAATILGLVFEPLGRLVGWAAYLWLTWTIRVVEGTARLPSASVPVTLSDAGLVAIYLVIAGVTAMWLLPAERRRALLQGLSARAPLKASLGGVAMVTIAIWVAMLQLPDDRLRVAFLDVGQGDAIYIETPGGMQMLIDGGPAGSVLLSELGRQMPFWDRSLDLVVLTHPDSDHVDGLISALAHYEVRAVVSREPLEQSERAVAWERALADEGAQTIRGESGTHMALNDGVALDVLYPGPEPINGAQTSTNNDSVVIRLTYGDVAVLLPGDIEAPVEEALARSGVNLASTVLKVPHHGGKSSTSQVFLDAVGPQIAVISVGEDNSFGHPSSEVLERLEGQLVYRTDENGTVTLSSDGHRLWIQTER
jgi:competence protein ComEC